MASEVNAAEAAAVDAAKPTQSDVRAAFRGRVVDHPDGTYTVDLAPRDGPLLVEMKRPWARKAHEYGRKRSEAVPTVAVRNRAGKVERLPASTEAGLAARGFRPYFRRRALTELRRGPDGLLERSYDGRTWSATGVCCLGEPLRPCGNPKCQRCHGE